MFRGNGFSSEGLSMERRFETRKRELIAECQVKPGVFEGMLERLRTFAEPFLSWLTRREQVDHGQTYLAGLLSNVGRKNVESIAYLHHQERAPLQAFVGTAPWEYQPLLDELAIQVARELGEPHGVLVFDPSGFPKKGDHSVGVSRQWCGRLGKLDNCQVGVYLGYVARAEHAIVDMRLYLPKNWANDAKRRRKCGVPKTVQFRTRHELALEMLDEQGDLLPHSWIAGDDEMGRSTRFRRDLAARKERYLLAVPSNTTIRDLRGEVPKGKRTRPFEQVRRWAEHLPNEAWVRIDVRDGHKSPLIVHAAMTRVVARTEANRIGPEETLVAVRVVEESGTVKFDYYLSNANHDTPLTEFARVAKAEHRIEECLQRGKSEAGLGHYQVRNWIGWHHHQTLSLIAAWFLVQESRREKKIGPGHDCASGPNHTCSNDRPDPWHRPTRPDCSRMPAPLATQGTRTAAPLETS
jgi:SRSO17 transposase